MPEESCAAQSHEGILLSIVIPMLNEEEAAPPLLD